MRYVTCVIYYYYVPKMTTLDICKYGDICQQNDGVVMGSPIGLVLAGILW